MMRASRRMNWDMLSFRRYVRVNARFISSSYDSYCSRIADCETHVTLRWTLLDFDI